MRSEVEKIDKAGLFALAVASRGIVDSEKVNLSRVELDTVEKEREEKDKLDTEKGKRD